MTPGSPREVTDLLLAWSGRHKAALEKRTPRPTQSCVASFAAICSERTPAAPSDRRNALKRAYARQDSGTLQN